jgi:hypothetical protein
MTFFGIFMKMQAEHSYKNSIQESLNLIEGLLHYKSVRNNYAIHKIRQIKINHYYLTNLFSLAASWPGNDVTIFFDVFPHALLM